MREKRRAFGCRRARVLSPAAPRRPRASQNSRRAIPASAEIRSTDYMGSTQLSSVGVCTMTLGLFQMTI